MREVNDWTIEDASLVEFMYPAFTRKPASVGDTGLCCCVP